MIIINYVQLPIVKARVNLRRVMTRFIGRQAIFVLVFGGCCVMLRVKKQALRVA